MTKEKKQSSTSENVFVRPPIVTIMGHVDHGKTSLLDYIRKSSVAAKEAGGITQSIGAYQADFKKKKITFIDTPGHAAFTNMRKRGSSIADVVILVVSAEDGVMPQTKEAISIAQFSKAPMIVALNKIDLPGANAQRVKQQLSENNVLVEDWGGEIICVEVSAKTGLGVDKLLESIVTLAEMTEFKETKESDFEGFIIESKLDPKRGPVFTGIVKNGTLKVGSEIFTSGTSGKVKALINYLGEQVKEAFPGDPVEILGFPAVPKVGEVFVDAKNKELFTAAEEAQKAVSESESQNCVNIVLKADTQGSLEALESSISALQNPEFSVRILHRATGDISESDIQLASASGALVFGFNTRYPSKVADFAEVAKVKVAVFKIIYELLENLEDILIKSIVKEEEKVKGRVLVQKLFPLPSGDVVAGCKVVAGAIKSTSKIEVRREGEQAPIYTGKLKSLRRGKDEVNVVGKDVECGILLKPAFGGLKSGDTIEVL